MNQCEFKLHKNKKEACQFVYENIVCKFSLRVTNLKITLIIFD